MTAESAVEEAERSIVMARSRGRKKTEHVRSRGAGANIT